MTEELSDRALKALFDELSRVRDASRPPYVRPVPAPARRSAWQRTSFRLPSLAAALLIAATATFLLVKRARRSKPSPPTIAEWSAPTDFLLQTPGRELLQSVSYDALSPVTHLTKGEGGRQ